MALEDKNKKSIVANELHIPDFQKNNEEWTDHDQAHSIEKRYKQIINSITDYIYSVRYNADGQANTIHTPTCTIITGYSIEEFDAHPSLWIDIVHQDDRQRVLEFSKKIGKDECSNIIEHRIWHKNGNLIWIQNTIITYFDKNGTFLGYDGVISDITQRKNNAEQVRLSEEKFRGIFNLSPDALILSDAETGHIYDYNQKFLQEFDLTREKISNIHIDSNLTIIEDWHRISSEIRSRNEINNKEVWGISKTGIRNIYLMSANIIHVSEKNYIIYQFRNISKRKKLEYLLRFIGQRGSLSEGKRFFNDLALFLSDLLNVSHVVIAETDIESKQVYNIVFLANGELMEDISPEPQDCPVYELISRGLYYCKSGIQSLLPEPNKFTEYKVDSFVGIILNNSEGLPSGYIAILDKNPLEDISEIQELLQIVALRVSHEMENMHLLSKIAEYREHLEDLVILRTTELENTIQALNVAKIKAESASNAKSFFLSNMSHELRTPLNAILGYASSLQKEQNINEKQKHNLLTIESSGQHLLSIINEILDYSKIEAGKITLENNEFNLSKLLFSALEMTKQKAWDKKLDFIYAQQSILPEIVTGDEKRLRQVLLNLISNSLKYTDRGSVTVRARFSTIPSETLFFEIEDTGTGIAEENFDKIFEPFTQLHQHKKYIEGTGLGLSITKNLVILMKGKIHFKSILNKGTTFFVEIPLKAVSYSSPEEKLMIEMEKNISEKEIKVPEKEIIHKISEYAKTGNFTSIENLIYQISHEDPAYKDFCTFINDHCNKYNDDAIIDFCNRFL